MWIHYERLHNHNKANHNKTVCIFFGIYCTHNVKFLSQCVDRSLRYNPAALQDIDRRNFSRSCKLCQLRLSLALMSSFVRQLSFPGFRPCLPRRRPLLTCNARFSQLIFKVFVIVIVIFISIIIIIILIIIIMIIIIIILLLLLLILFFLTITQIWSLEIFAHFETYQFDQLQNCQICELYGIYCKENWLACKPC